jgi:hypothetical protein
MRWLSQRINDFIAHLANVDTIILLAESKLNEFSRRLSERSNFDSFFMNLRPTAQKERNEFYRCLIEQGNDFIAD